MPKDRVTQMHQGYGFVEFMGEEDADYSIKIMNMIKLYGKPIRVNKVYTFFFIIFTQVFLTLKLPMCMQIYVEKPLVEIQFIYLGSKEIFCIFKTCCMIWVLFSTQCRVFHSFVFFCSNNMFFIKHALKFK